MAVRILHDPVGDIAALYCSTDGVAFGPVFEDDALEKAETFLGWFQSGLAAVVAVRLNIRPTRVRRGRRPARLRARGATAAASASGAGRPRLRTRGVRAGPDPAGAEVMATHYEEAVVALERADYIANADNWSTNPALASTRSGDVANKLAEAQVWATLALADAITEASNAGTKAIYDGRV